MEFDSLVASALSSPLSTSRTEGGFHGGGLDGLTDASTRPSTHRTAMSEIKVSDLFLPLEQRLQARIEALEAEVMRRCAQLEGKVSILVETQAERPSRSASRDRERPSAKLLEVEQTLHQSLEKQSALQGNIDELWRQLKADQQKGMNKINSVADTVDLLQGFVQRLSQSSSESTGVAAASLRQHPPAELETLEAITKSVATPSLHASEDDDQVSMVMLSAIPPRTTSHELRTSEPAAGSGSTGVRRRHSSGLAPPTSLQASSAASCGRSPGSSPTQRQRAVRPTSPQATRGGGSPRTQQRPAPAVGPTAGVRRGISAPFNAAAFMASKGTRQGHGLAARA